VIGLDALLGTQKCKNRSSHDYSDKNAKGKQSLSVHSPLMRLEVPKNCLSLIMPSILRVVMHPSLTTEVTLVNLLVSTFTESVIEAYSTTTSTRTDTIVATCITHTSRRCYTKSHTVGEWEGPEVSILSEGAPMTCPTPPHVRRR